MSQMPFADVEQVYEMLALAIDRAGREHEALLLAKLALMLAYELGDLARVTRCVDAALQDMPAPDTSTDRRIP
jgi:hypothetical protein